ncbi:MAG: fructose bisphosphate aldolase [Alphaproteobacteria bacterium]
MNEEQLQRMKSGKGFIAALDQSGGSTPKTLANYGVNEKAYSNENEMLEKVQEMRKRIILSPAFSSEHILGAILFEDTMNREINELLSADYLWQKKGVVPFLKIDKGLADEQDGVQIMKHIPDIDKTLELAGKRHIFGTKMRSLIKKANPEGIKHLVEQQFEYAKQIANANLVPIVEPEVDIHSPEKREAEKILKEEIIKQLQKLPKSTKIMLKLSIPTDNNYYYDLLKDEHIIRIVALSGGYSALEANEKLSQNKGIIASFSRTLIAGLTAQQTDETFNRELEKTIEGIYQASLT